MTSEELGKIAHDWLDRYEQLKSQLKESSLDCKSKSALIGDIDFAWSRFRYYTNKQTKKKKKEVTPSKKRY